MLKKITLIILFVPTFLLSFYMLDTFTKAPLLHLLGYCTLAMIGLYITKKMNVFFNDVFLAPILTLVEESLLSNRLIRLRKNVFELAFIFLIFSIGYDPVVDLTMQKPVPSKINISQLGIDLTLVFGAIGIYLTVANVVYLMWVGKFKSENS